MSEIKQNKQEAEHPRFSYADYEKAIRGPHYDALRKISHETAALFEKCDAVLDIASGQGMVLDALRERNISSYGLDNEPHLVEACRSRGLEVIEEDALHFLKTTVQRFDGVNCAHLIEHLPYEVMLDLIEGARRVLEPGGLFVLRWPNPRSGLTQFQSFWKDPTHDRFYDGAFVQAVLEFYGFEMKATHYDTVEPREYSKKNAEIQIGRSKSTRMAFLRQWLKRQVKWLLSKPFHAIRLIERRQQHREKQWSLEQASQLFVLPVEAQIIARRGQD